MDKKDDFRELYDQMPKCVREFASYKTAIENRSIKTVTEYMFDLRTMFRFLVAHRSGISLTGEEFEKINLTGIDLDFVAAITTEELYEFLMYAGDTRSNEWSAKARKLSAIKAFFKYLTVKVHKLDVNPAINIDSPKKKGTLPKHLSLDESVDLLHAVENDAESKTKERDFAILTLFLNCGMRLSELVGIDINDIDPEMRSLTVTGKGNKERIVYLNDACRAALVKYFTVRLALAEEGNKSPALFLSGRGVRISPKTVQWMVYKYLGAAGLDYKGYSTHKLRHTAATLMYQTGKVDIRVLKDILGHEQLNTTQIYTHVSDASMENAVNSNPLSKIKPDK